MHVQTTLDDLGTPLAEVTFVVVDLETTGGSPADSAITEIGAVRVRGGEVLSEFQTLVRPHEPIPAFISVLTGITDGMVADAPPIGSALPAFLEFARGAVLVAHNARFDIGFLKAAARACETDWPGAAVLDTVHLARQVVSGDEAPNHKLSTLARVFHATTTPTHRALDDARATVDVLHGLIARVGSLGVDTLEELTSYTSRVPPARRRKRFLADDLPGEPGVYVFKDGGGNALYVGTSVDIRTRVRSYFTASEHRARMTQMVDLAESVTPIVCATTLEAEVRELRLIAEQKPPFNRRSRNPGKVHWVKLTREAFPRLSVVRLRKDDETAYLGPFPSRNDAREAVDAIHEVIPLRQCVQRLRASARGSACILADMGRCGAPCTGAQDAAQYAVLTGRAAAAFTGDARPLVESLRGRLEELSGQERYEEAARIRDRLLILVRGASRSQRLAPLFTSREIVAARRSPLGGWELVCVRHGRLAGSTMSPTGADPMPYVDALRASADVVAPDPAWLSPSTEEAEKILRWLEMPQVRLVVLDGEWSCPVGGAEAAHRQLEPMATARRAAAGFL